MTNEVMQQPAREQGMQSAEGGVAGMRLFLAYLDENTIKSIIVVLFLGKGTSQAPAVNAENGDG